MCCAHVEGEVHACELPVALEVVERVVEDTVLHEARMVVRHHNLLQTARLLDRVPAVYGQQRARLSARRVGTGGPASSQ